ncbi:MAG TPA: Imm5 family immunity protein [Herpetosiphonaceae bacterium]
METRADHALLPVYRQDIFLGLKLHPHESRFRARLGLAMMRDLLPLWQASGTELPEFDHALWVLDQLGSSERERHHVNAAIEQLEEAFREFWRMWWDEPPDHARLIMRTLVSALREALGRDPLYECHFDVVVTDEDLDLEETDAARWAAMIWGGRVGKPGDNPFQRRAFWGWWLTVAVPEALEGLAD